MVSYKKIALLIVGVSFLLLAIGYLRDILIPFFLAISIAYLFHPIVNYFEKKNISRSFAIVIVYIALFVMLTFFAFGILPILYKQINNLIIELPVVFADLEKSIDGLHTYFYKNNGLPKGISSLITDSVVRMETKILGEIKAVMSLALSAVAYLPLLVLTPFLAFYLLNDSKEFALKFIRLFPEKHHRNITSFIYDLNTTLMHYIRGQIFVGILVGTLTTLGLLIIKMPMAIFLGALTGIAELIPFFGPFISGAIIVLLALTLSTKKAALAFSVFVIIQQLEANIITPKILGNCVGLHPLTIIFLILLGGKYFGVVGMFFIVPLFAVLKIFIAHAIPFIKTLESN